MIWFCFPVSQFSRLDKKRSENHTPSGAKQCESVRMWDCVTGIWEWYVPCVSSHLRLLESQIVWMGYESNFYLTFANALILVPSMSCFSSWKKLLKVHENVVASQNFIRTLHTFWSLPKFHSILTFWSLPKLWNAILWFGNNLEIFFLVGSRLRQFRRFSIF